MVARNESTERERDRENLELVYVITVTTLFKGMEALKRQPMIRTFEFLQSLELAMQSFFYLSLSLSLYLLLRLLINIKW
jgi:hypothetical protein